MNRTVVGLVTLVGLGACAADHDKAESLTAVTRACGIAGDRVLSGEGIGEFRIGATVEQLQSKCEVVRDTTLEHGNEGMPERRLTIRLEQDTIEATIENDRVWRINVLSPRFRTPDSLGVGSTAAILQRQRVKYLGYGEGGPFVSLPTHCGLSFRLTGVGKFAATMDHVPPSATVAEILILGCAGDHPVGAL